jgi:hypothetical protein
MGCLTVNISSVSIPDACKASAAGMNSEVAVTGDALNWLSAIACNRNKDIDSNAVPANTTLITTKISKGMAIAITAALVCEVVSGDYEYFYVTEGPLVVQDGYFMVKRNLN